MGLNYAAEHNQGPAFPFAECGAMSQAYIGYQLQESLQNELHSIGMDKQVVTLVTQVEVDENDPAFNNPSKPIGLFYNKEEAEQIQKKKDLYLLKMLEEDIDALFLHHNPSLLLN